MSDMKFAAANDNPTIDDRLKVFAESLRRVIAGEPDADVDRILAEASADWDEPWRYDIKTERVGIVLSAGLEIIDDMLIAVYASLPQQVRDADAAAHAAARAEMLRLAAQQAESPLRP